MADDQSRPTENDNQDAENQTPRTAESDREADPDTAADPPESDRERGVEEITAEDEAVTEENELASDGDEAVSDEDEAVEVDETPVEGDEGVEVDEPVASEDASDPEESGLEAADPKATDQDATEQDATEPDTGGPTATEPDTDGPDAEIPEDVRKYERFKKMDGAQYDRVNEFLRERTYITAREWAIARLCADFRTETGVEMTKIGENLPELVPFMTDTYTPQAVNQARSSFEEKIRQAGATFLYGAMSGFFTAEELDDMMYEVTEVAKFLLEVEGVDLSVEEELEAEDRISGVMREVQSASEELRHDELECPHCGHEMEAAETDTADSVESDD